MKLSAIELGNYLKAIRENLGYSIYDVNKLCDISPSYLSLVENGKRKPSAIILKKIAPIYSLDYLDLYEKAGYIDLIEDEKEQLLNNIGATPLSEIKTSLIPLLGTVKAGYDYLAQENIVEYIPFKVKGTDLENYYALDVTGNSMEPLFDEGDTVIVHKQNDFQNGDNCVVLINGNEATVKQVYVNENGIELKAINPYYPAKTFTKEEVEKLPVKVIGIVERAIRNLMKK